MTDPDHAWDTHEEEPEPAPVTAVAAVASSGNDLVPSLRDYEHFYLIQNSVLNQNKTNSLFQVKKITSSIELFMILNLQILMSCHSNLETLLL